MARSTGPHRPNRERGTRRLTKKPQVIGGEGSVERSGLLSRDSEVGPETRNVQPRLLDLEPSDEARTHYPQAKEIMERRALLQRIGDQLMPNHLAQHIRDHVAEVALVPHGQDPRAIKAVPKAESHVTRQLDPAHGLAHGVPTAHEERVEMGVDDAEGDEARGCSLLQDGADDGASLPVGSDEHGVVLEARRAMPGTSGGQGRRDGAHMDRTKWIGREGQIFRSVQVEST